VISRSNLSCGYLVLPGLAGTQEDAGSTREGVVESVRHDRPAFSKGLDMNEAQISRKDQIKPYLSWYRFCGLAR